MTFDDEIKKVVQRGGSINEVRQAFRKQKSKLLQEAALARVEAGDTSLAEVKRVMEAAAGASGASPAPEAAGPPPTKPTGGAPGSARPATRPAGSGSAKPVKPTRPTPKSQ